MKRLSRGAGKVRCTSCFAEAAADGKGTPITLRHADGCGNLDKHGTVKDFVTRYPRPDATDAFAVLEHVINVIEDEGHPDDKVVVETSHSAYAFGVTTGLTLGHLREIRDAVDAYQHTIALGVMPPFAKIRYTVTVAI